MFPVHQNQSFVYLQSKKHVKLTTKDRLKSEADC